jgi:hypothetical protein
MGTATLNSRQPHNALRATLWVNPAHLKLGHRRDMRKMIEAGRDKFRENLLTRAADYLSQRQRAEP